MYQLGKRWMIAICLAGCCVNPALAGDKQAGMGRIDVIAVGNRFELARPRVSPKARLSRCSWLGKDKERTGVSCEKWLAKEWEELWVEFVAGGDGQVTIDLQG